MRVEVRVHFDFDKDTITKLYDPSLDAYTDYYAWENNVSNANSIIDSESYAYNGFKGFQLSDDTTDKIPAVLNGAYKCFPDSGYRGYISKELSDADGRFRVWIVLKLSVSGEIPKYLFVRGDPATNSYPTSYDIVSIDSSIAISVTSKSMTNIVDLTPLNLSEDTTAIGILFYTINKPQQSLKLTQLSFGYLGVYKENELKSCENSEQAFSSSMNLSPGLVTQYADITIYDRSNFIHDLAKNEALKSRQDAHIYAVEDDGTKKDVGSYKADNWDVPSGSSDVTITCTDDTDALDNTYCESGEVADRSVHKLLALAFSFLNAAWQYVDADTEDYCKSIITPNSWYYNGTIKKLLDKICQLGQLNIYKHLGVYTIVRCY